MQNTTKAPDYSAIKGELDQVLVCVKDEGVVQNYKYKNLDEIKLHKGGKTIGELSVELETALRKLTILEKFCKAQAKAIAKRNKAKNDAELKGAKNK